MKRSAFNGGEISPEMALRADMDVYARSCSKLVNFDVSQMGGISRRRGMRRVEALDAGDESAIFPYTYTDEHVYLIEIRQQLLIVRDREGAEVERFEREDVPWEYWTPEKTQVLQMNAILLILSPTCPIMQLRLDYMGEWSLERFRFKMPPWNTIDTRETDIRLTPVEREHGYAVEWDESEDANEYWTENMDILRASYFTQQQEAFEKASLVLQELSVVDGITAASIFAAGTKVAVRGEAELSYWVCSEEWNGNRDFVEGLPLPGNYRDNFIQAEDLTGFDAVEPIYKLSADVGYARGAKLVIESGYWEYFTCVREFTAEDFREGATSPADYPAHFVRGLAVGPAMTSKGTWSFYCSGTWYGSYEVRRCYEGEGLEGQWESRGESFSRIGSPANEQISGNEEEEECWLRLFITRSLYLGGSTPEEVAAGYPSDGCSNRLIVESYKHDMLLRCEVFGEEVVFLDESPVRIALPGDLITPSWSWQAFSRRYGYPTVALLHESRLVIASTDAQPQTLWFSATDDLNNFGVGELDSSGMLLTMATSTQAGICWACSRGDSIMLGTEGAEWCIKGTDNGPLTAKNVRLVNYGYNGSAHMPALLTSDSVLYVERGSGRVYRYGYSYESNSYTSTDLTVFAPHVAEERGGIVRGTEMRKPDHKAVFVMGDGSLSLMTYNLFHNVNAWHHYETEGRVLAACALPNGNAADKLFLVVEREGEHWLEVMDGESDYSDAEGLDYTSTMETTAFSDPQGNDGKVPLSCFEMYLAEDCPKSGIEVLAGAKQYTKFSGDAQLRRGWVKLTGKADWTQEPTLGIRCRSNRPLRVLAVQA